MKRQTVEEMNAALDQYETRTVLASHNGKRLIASTTHYADGMEPYTIYEIGGWSTPNLRIAIAHYCEVSPDADLPTAADVRGLLRGQEPQRSVDEVRRDLDAHADAARAALPHP